MSKGEKALSNAELELTQRIQMHFPRGRIPPQLLQDWVTAPKDVLEGWLNECFQTYPSSVVAGLNKKHNESIAGFTKPEGLDFTIRVDRSRKPASPGWSDKVMHPDLECTGPAEYDLKREVEQWLHPAQSTGLVCGNTIYGLLETDGTLASHLGLADLLAIQARGIAIFRALFKGKAVFGWKSVARGRDSRDLDVPFLYEYGYKVVLSWQWLGSGWSPRRPALRFRK